MDQEYSLSYYDEIFGNRGPDFQALVEALSEELRSYSQDMATLLATRNLETLGRLRHSHRPLVKNLKLTVLADLEDQIRQALEAGVTDLALGDLGHRFSAQAEALARAIENEAR